MYAMVMLKVVIKPTLLNQTNYFANVSTIPVAHNAKFAVLVLSRRNGKELRLTKTSCVNAAIVIDTLMNAYTTQKLKRRNYHLTCMEIMMVVASAKIVGIIQKELIVKNAKLVSTDHME